MELFQLAVFVILFIQIKAASWNYNSYGADWADICSTGTSQSPINLDLPSARIDESLGQFSFLNYDLTNKYSTIINNGHTVQVNMADDTVRVSGGGLDSGEYTLAQFHLHWGITSLSGSEHTVDNKMYPMEIHFVHYKSSLGSLTSAVAQPNGLAVLGFLFELSGRDNQNLDFFISKIQNVSNKDTTGVNLGSKPPPQNIFSGVDRTKFVRYSGSLTTPTCNEVVQWTVFTDTIPISESQLTKIRATYQDAGATIIGYNFRPIQAQGNRVVKISYKPEVNGSSRVYNSFFFIVAAVAFYVMM